VTLAAPAATVDETPPPVTAAVRFDDIGASFVVPDGARVLGDDEIARRVRASSAAKMRGVLVDRAAMRRGIPLLALERERGLDVTLSAVVVMVIQQQWNLTTRASQCLRFAFAKYLKFKSITTTYE